MRAHTALASLSFGAVGACLTLPGSLLPVLVEDFDIRLVEAGSMLALQGIGYLATVLAARTLIRRFGSRRVVAGGLFVFGLGTAAFGATTHWIAAAAAMLLSGLGFGSMEVAGNALILALGGARNTNLLNFVHLFFGVGSLAAPMLITRAASAGVSWRWLFAIAGVATMLIGLAWIWVADVASRDEPRPEDVRPRSRVVPFLLASTLGVYVGAEMGIGSWLTKFMVGDHGVSLTYAGNVLSAYWLGLAAGRFLLSFAAHHVEEKVLLLALSVAATASLVVAVTAASPAIAALAFVATGLGYSGIFPSVIALGGRHQPENAAAITSTLIAGAGVGGIVVPWLMSAISDASSVSSGMVFYAVMTAVMTVLAAALLKRAV